MATRILVPLDGSPLAEQALPCAMTLGRGLPAELVLLRAVSIPLDVRESFADTGLLEEGDRLHAAADDYLQGITDQLREAGLSVRHIVQRGPAAEAIVDYAKQTDVRWIVIATHGYSGIKRWTHGSVAERVLQAASVPVLMVRAREGALGDPHQPMSCQRILVPLDGSDVAEQVLPAVTPIAQALGSEMILFRVPTFYVMGTSMDEWFMPLESTFEMAERDAEAYLDRAASCLKEQGVNASTATRMGAVAESIVEYAEAKQVDLIAMCTHGRTGLARWALGSVADRVLRAGSIPILLVRAR